MAKREKRRVLAIPAPSRVRKVKVAVKATAPVEVRSRALRMYSDESVFRRLVHVFWSWFKAT